MLIKATLKKKGLVASLSLGITLSQQCLAILLGLGLSGYIMPAPITL